MKRRSVPGSSSPLHILIVSPFYDERVETLPEALNRFPILRELPKELQALGHHVQFLGLGPTRSAFSMDGVQYRWESAARPLQIAGLLAHRLKPHYGPSYYAPSLRIALAARRMKPDIIHVFGLTMDLQLSLIRVLANRDSHLVVHYHGGAPAQGAIRKRLQRFATGRIEAALFTSESQATSWIMTGLLEPRAIHQVLETSSPFTGIDRETARGKTGMTGNPVYLSAGRLHPIKDPLTMLRGFADIARRQPDARLYLYYLTGEMLNETRAFVHSFSHLRSRVEFRGRANADEMEAIYSSADVLLQASRREWSGLAILEAMSCGCIPVVSDIPSFAAMTDNGRYGRLFTPGDAHGLARAALSIGDPAMLSAATKEHFRKRLSFSAMAGQLDGIYRELVDSR